MASPSEQTLLVTGATGFIGAHIVKLALAKGYKVLASVRSESSGQTLRNQFPDYVSQLGTVVVPDITVVSSYAAAFADDVITGVLHLASPFVLHAEDNARDLLDPAVNGAVAILEAARRYGGGRVRRVVVTSSFAAIIDLGRGTRHGYTYTEADWNPMTYEEAKTADGTTAYCASKALAERAIWAWGERERPDFSIASINPPWVFGPHVTPPADLGRLNESTALLWNIVGANAVPGVDFAGFADVRDVAAAHMAALERPEAAGQRFLVGSHFDYQSAVDAARDEIPELRERLPEGTPGKTEEVYVIDGSKAERVLGIRYTPLRQTMKDSYAQLLAVEKR